MTAATFEIFDAQARAEGFDEVLVREWAPDAETGEHRHAFDVSAMVVRGEFWLTVDGDTRLLAAGDSFRLPRDVPHSEKYGSAGATVWVARAN